MTAVDQRTTQTATTYLEHLQRKRAFQFDVGFAIDVTQRDRSSNTMIRYLYVAFVSEMKQPTKTSKRPTRRVVQVGAGARFAATVVAVAVIVVTVGSFVVVFVVVVVVIFGELLERELKVVGVVERAHRLAKIVDGAARLLGPLDLELLVAIVALPRRFAEHRDRLAHAAQRAHHDVDRQRRIALLLVVADDLLHHAYETAALGRRCRGRRRRR